MNKQTAVEWLEEQIKDIFYVAEASEMTKKFKSIYQQAKKMEKQQIEEAYQAGQDNVDYTASFVDEDGLENYYNKTYGDNNE
jgi:hypothetical protein